MSESNRVWSKFSRRSKCGDSELRFRIQDMPSDRFDDVMDLFNNYFTKEETLHKAAGVHKSVEAQTELMDFLREMLTESAHRITICCTDDDSNTTADIVGASVVVLATKDDPDDMNVVTKTKEVSKFFELMDTMFGLYDVMKQLNLEKFYDDRGVVVHPHYRGLGIAQQLFHVRRMICKDEDIPVTGAWMTAAGSQKAAQRDGWEIVFEHSYEELGKQHGIVFENVPPTFAFMVARI